MFVSAANNLNANATIVEAARKNGAFSMLAAVVEAAELVDTLASPGPFTVFAPTDAAFSKLPHGVVERLLRPENRVALASFVARHILPGHLTAAALREQAHETEGPVTLRNVDNDVIHLEERDDGLHLLAAHGAWTTLLDTDLLASNGVIHVTDSVLATPMC